MEQLRPYEGFNPTYRPGEQDVVFLEDVLDARDAKTRQELPILPTRHSHKILRKAVGHELPSGLEV